MIHGLKSICDCGIFGQARKIKFKIGNKNYYFYSYFGNPNQDFVADEKGNDITNTKLGIEIKLSGANYIINKYY